MSDFQKSVSTTKHWQKQEFLVFVLILVIFLLFLPSAQINARRQFRDEVRITTLAETKQKLEQHYNAYESFPVPKSETPLACAVSSPHEEISLWYQAPSQQVGAVNIPPEKKRGWFPYLYCPTDVFGTTEDPEARAFFLETVLERSQKPIAATDEEKGRNYRYRIYHDGPWTRYRICGGTDRSCDDMDQPLYHYASLALEESKKKRK